MLLPTGRKLVDERLAAGDLVAVVTATNSFITRPIAALYGISHLVATEPEVVDGRFTGRPSGEPCFQAGKLDLPGCVACRPRTGGFRISPNPGSTAIRTTTCRCCSAVTHPVAIDPDPVLAAEAAAQGWPIASWR